MAGPGAYERVFINSEITDVEEHILLFAHHIHSYTRL
jgi:hypothetical protein